MYLTCRPALWPLLALLIMCLCAPIAHAETIRIRSGNNGSGPLPPGAAWTSAHCWHSDKSQSPLKPPHALQWPFFNVGDFAMACAGTSPVVVSPTDWPVKALASDPLARWVNWNGYPLGPFVLGFPPRSTMYCVPFTVTSSQIASAKLEFRWACDDRLGDVLSGANHSGVYINELPVVPIISVGSFKYQRSETRDITGLVHPGLNHLYVYQRDMYDVSSGLLLSAIITVCPPVTTTITVRSGSVSGVPGTPGQVADQLCLSGPAQTPLRSGAFTVSDFAACTAPSLVVGGPWASPPGMDPASRWISANANGQNWGAPATSAMFVSTFQVPAGAIPAATMTFLGAADDGLGDGLGGPNPGAVYLNGAPVATVITSTGFGTTTTASCPVTLIPGAVNTIHVYQRDAAAAYSGVIFSAQFAIQLPPCTPQLVDPMEPQVLDAHVTSPSAISVVLDRAVTPASAEDLSSYSLGSFRSIVSATLDSSGMVVTLQADSPGSGTLETVTVINLVSADAGVAMAVPMTRSFWDLLLSASDVQKPDPDSLAAPFPADRSRFALASEPGERVTLDAISLGPVGEVYAFADGAGQSRGGVLVEGAETDLQTGHRYSLAANVMEIRGETHLIGTDDVIDLGMATIPNPVIRSLAVFRDTTVDVTQSFETGEDFEGMLVEIDTVIVQSYRDSTDFLVFDPDGGPADTLRIRGYQLAPSEVPALGTQLNVRGILLYRDGAYCLAPRGVGDLVIQGVVDAGDARSPLLSLTAFPNPARSNETIRLTLPDPAAIVLTVHDVSGRRVAQIASELLGAGPHSYSWNGCDAGGKRVPPGVYFVHLKVGSEARSARLVIVQ